MKRKIEFGCLIILSVLWLLFVAFSLRAQSSGAFHLDSQVDTMTLDKESFRVLFSNRLGIPKKVEYTVSPSDLGQVKRSPALKFKTDKDTPKPRVSSSMYSNSGFQRGHMCPAASRNATDALMRSTFIMSNVCPQAVKLNTGKWKMTETRERAVARQTGMCNVIAAPLFLPDDTLWIGNGRVAVPHMFYKMIYTSNPPHVYGWYIFENK